MSQNLYVARVSGVSLAAATAKTLAQIITTTNQRAFLCGWGISFNGTDATKEPILVDVLRQTTAGTSSSLTVVEAQPGGAAPVTTALQTFTVEPTAGDILWSAYFTPVGGGTDVMLYPGDEFVLEASTRIGIRVTTGAAVTCTAAAFLKFRE